MPAAPKSIKINESIKYISIYRCIMFTVSQKVTNPGSLGMINNPAFAAATPCRREATIATFRSGSALRCELPGHLRKEIQNLEDCEMNEGALSLLRVVRSDTSSLKDLKVRLLLQHRRVAWSRLGHCVDRNCD